MHNVNILLPGCGIHRIPLSAPCVALRLFMRAYCVRIPRNSPPLAQAAETLLIGLFWGFISVCSILKAETMFRPLSSCLLSLLAVGACFPVLGRRAVSGDGMLSADGSPCGVPFRFCL